jgi:hypothetical protein
MSRVATEMHTIEKHRGPCGEVRPIWDDMRPVALSALAYETGRIHVAVANRL